MPAVSKKPRGKKVIESDEESDQIAAAADQTAVTGTTGQEESDAESSASDLTPPPPTSQEVQLAKRKPTAKAQPDRSTNKEFGSEVPDTKRRSRPSLKTRGSQDTIEEKQKPAKKGRKSQSGSAAPTEQLPPSASTPPHHPDSEVNPDQSATLGTEGSSSPRKKLTLKLKGTKSTSTPTSTMTGDETNPSESQSALPTQKPQGKKAPVAKDRKANALTVEKADSSAEANPQADAGPSKKTKVTIKRPTESTAGTPEKVESVSSQPGDSKAKKLAGTKKRKTDPSQGEDDGLPKSLHGQSPEGSPKKVKLSLKKPAAVANNESAPAQVQGTQKPKEKSGQAVQSKAKQKRAERTEYTDSDSEEEQTVVKPKKKVKRGLDDDHTDQDTRPAKNKVTIEDVTLRSPNKPQHPGTSPMPERAAQSSPPKAFKPLKGDKARQADIGVTSVPSEKKGLTSKVKAEAEKEGGLVRSKSTPQLSGAYAAEGSAKKPLPAKKAGPRPSGGLGTPGQAPPKTSMGLLGNTLALLQGSGTPKGKEGKKDKEGNKEQPKPVRKGGWTDEWILTPEEEKQYEASRLQREAERKKREEWRKDPVNLQESKNAIRVDSMQARSTTVPASMGIRSTGQASQIAKAVLGW